MLLAGCIVLSVWCAASIIFGWVMVMAIMTLRATPLFVLVTLTREEWKALPPKAQDTFRALAVALNAETALFGIFGLVIIWNGLSWRQEWGLWAMLVGGGVAQVFQYVVDGMMGNKTLGASLGMTALLLVGLGLSAYGMFGG